ncbi:MAG: aminoacetone oxidase family FAD-binding enzyme [Candidatus Cloacimonetes bacterium]|nr:aminoacetone oxidase family FAD-binding enzyme [Candidatus Cloacimonadota bacterium]
MNQKYDVVILGAGASGLFCAFHLAKRGKKVLVLEHNKFAGKKILVSGGGKCNFTNQDVSINNYVSKNPRFCHSALANFASSDFLDMIHEYDIPYEQRELGKYFCKNSSKDIQKMLLSECKKYKANLVFSIQFMGVESRDNQYYVECLHNNQFIQIQSEHFIVASGGLSFETLGSTNIGYKIAEQFGLKMIPTKPGLVSLEFSQQEKEVFKGLQGIALKTQLSTKDAIFHEAMLFTHTGISGPCTLQISSHWTPGQTIQMNFALGFDFQAFIQEEQDLNPKKSLENTLAKEFPKKLVHALLSTDNSLPSSIDKMTPQHCDTLANLFCNYQLIPRTTSGYNKAEITCGGVNTKSINPKTMEVKSQKNLYFIGEVLDVSGWLGGYNFQWAWASAYACSQSI